MTGSKHIGRYEERGYMIDGWACSCGWKSSAYFDGAEYAAADWKTHLREEIKIQNSEDHKRSLMYLEYLILEDNSENSTLMDTLASVIEEYERVESDERFYWKTSRSR